MKKFLKEITQITIYLKQESERVNEVAIFQPLMRNSHFNEQSKPLNARKWRFNSNLSFFRQFFLKVQSLVFKYIPPFIPKDRLTPEAKFKTVLAMLLVQEEVRDFFLANTNRQRDFFSACQTAAYASGWQNFSPPTQSMADMPLKISRSLTQLEGKEMSLIDDLIELNLQMATLNQNERNEILYRILNCIERPPITSVMEIASSEQIFSIPLTTTYAKYKVNCYDATLGKVHYSYEENHATSSIRTPDNTLPNAKGAMNQRLAVDAANHYCIGSYCGELSSSYRVLEQILLILTETQGSLQIEQMPTAIAPQEKKIIFTSLYSWHELSMILDQQMAIRAWDQKVLRSQDSCSKLNLLYFNISFNAFNRYPAPAEMKANIEDINEEATIVLLAEAFSKLHVEHEKFREISSRVLSLKELGDRHFIEREKSLYEEIDSFRKIKPQLIALIHHLPRTHFTQAIGALLTQKTRDKKALRGIDKLLYLDFVAKELGYLHNKNCNNALDRSAGADASDKAQYAFQKIMQIPFLPCNAQREERDLFKVLYSMYLVWEEPEINTWLSTGFIGEKFYNNFIQKNPETTRYLIQWLKKHPEIYLGLSDYRT